MHKSKSSNEVSHAVRHYAIDFPTTFSDLCNKAGLNHRGRYF